MRKHLEKINLRDIYMKLVRKVQTCLLISKRSCVAYNTITEEWSNIHIGEYIHGNGLVITASSLIEKNGKLESEENFIMPAEFSMFKELITQRQAIKGEEWIVFSLAPPTITSLKALDIFGVTSFCYLYISEQEHKKVASSKWHEVMINISKALGIKILPINIKDK